MLILDEAEVGGLLTMEGCIKALEALFRAQPAEKPVNMPRVRIATPHGSHQVMAGGVPALGVTAVKTYVTAPTARRQARMLVVLYDTTTGEPLALVAGRRLGAIRTGAASGVATRQLARLDAEVVAIVGAGLQARTQLAGVCAVRSIREARVFSRDAGKRARFADEMGQQLGVPVVIADSADDAVTGADVICLATTSPEPVIDGAAISPGTHVNAVGSNNRTRRELGEDAIRRADVVVVDDLADARLECGDLIAASERGAFDWDHASELADVVTGRAPGRRGPDAITLFESQGLAVEDAAAATHVYHRAMEQGIGREVSLW